MTEEKLNKANDIRSQRDFCKMVLAWGKGEIGLCTYRNGSLSRSVLCPGWLCDAIAETVKKRFDELDAEFKEL